VDHIVLDVEIQKTIEETPGGWDSTNLLGVACAVVYEFQADRFRVYGPDDVERLKNRILKADRVSGFNIWKFDYPVIWAKSRADWPIRDLDFTQPLYNTCDDILRRIWQALFLNPDAFSAAHKGWSLNAVAGSTLGTRKIGFGGDAPKWFQNGEHARVINYCIDDVAIERDLGLFIDKYGYVLNGNRILTVPPWQGSHPEAL
jgi:DEAD/DEAH box helicase domain-containing protein